MASKAWIRVATAVGVFDSVQECAKALGIKPDTVYGALSKGREKYLGMGRGNNPNSRKALLPPKPVKIGSREFPSRVALAEYIGYTDRHVTKLIREGRMDVLMARAMKADAEREAKARREHEKRMNEGIPKKC